ncbi:discoidin domain-containing protein [Paenibacillus sp. Soil750]|uniref:discoidin domain-containing protein n=1 Tax=Paenibacillus sp. Soil750 TaxID=1736398 RepID=UPI0006FE7F82|nr:discoidin domain-containing protein [Paenibacillus sp. Soil750]KRE69728.1 hypothetical protein ASL11_15280 [Paenibacillus sp. Soil750]
MYILQLRRNVVVILILSLVFALFDWSLNSSKVNAANTAVSITSNYATNAGNYDKTKLLNVARGGHLTNKNLHWLPSYYDMMAADGIDMMRIDWVLSDQFYHLVSRNGSGQLVYDFTMLDAVVLPLVQKGIKPFMCLAYLPSVIGGSGVSGVGYPTNLSEYQAIVQAVVQHYVNLGYTGWYWESHNEADASVGGGLSATQINTMYQYFATGVRAVDSTAKIGGAGFANNKATNTKIIGFMDFIQANPTIPFDYLSVHQYGGADFNDSLNAMFTSRGIPQKDIIYSEWNYDYTSGTAGSVKDTNINAAYMAKRMYSAILRPELKKVMFFTPADALSTTDLFFGDSGIYTLDGHRKSGANTFNMYSKLEPTILTSTLAGTGTSTRDTYGIVTKDPVTKEVSMLLWNYTATPADMTISLSNLPYLADATNIKVNKTLVDSTNGNYYADYASGYRGTQVGPNENPGLKESSILSSSSTFSRIETLPANSVMQITLSPTTSAPTAGPVDTLAPLPPCNLAASKPVVTSSSLESPTTGWQKSLLTDGINYSFEMADVGNTNMGWTSNPGYTDPNHTEWAYVDLGTSTTVNKIVLYARNDVSNDGKAFPVDFKIQGSTDATNWTDLVTKTNFNSANPVNWQQPFSFTSGSYRYVRVNATKLSSVGGSYKMQLAEFQVYNTNLSGCASTTPLNLALNKSVSATSSVENYGWLKTKINDGLRGSTSSTARGWSSALGVTTNHTESVTIDLGTVNSISKVDLYPRNDSGQIGSYFPIDFTIQVSSNGTTWTTVVSKTNYTKPTTGSVQSFTFATVNARYVKVESTNLRVEDGLNYMMQIPEMEVY